MVGSFADPAFVTLQQSAMARLQLLGLKEFEESSPQALNAALIAPVKSMQRILYESHHVQQNHLAETGSPRRNTWSLCLSESVYGR